MAVFQFANSTSQLLAIPGYALQDMLTPAMFAIMRSPQVIQLTTSNDQEARDSRRLVAADSPIKVNDQRRWIVIEFIYRSNCVDRLSLIEEARNRS